MRYLVTGANGYIGSHVVSKLLKKGHEVSAVDVRYDNVDPGAFRLDADIFGENENIYKELKEPDVCIHLAWRNGFIHNADTHIQDLPGHYMFLKNMISGGLKHLVVMGTMHEIGYWEGAIDEQSPANPQSAYGIAKNTLRQLAQQLTAGKEICFQWIRGYYIMGDDLKNHSIFTKIMEAAMAGKKEFPFTSGKNKYDFMDVSELTDQIVAVSEQTAVDGVINCCTGKPVSLAEKVENYIKENDLDIRLNYGAYPDRPYDSPGVWGDPYKINLILANEKRKSK